MVVINLSDLHRYCTKLSKPFDKICADAIAHEIFHLNIMDELKASIDSEEWIIAKLVDVEPY